MDNHMLSMLILTTLIGLTYQQFQLPPQCCLLSRLDYVPCLYQNGNIRRASPNNEFSIHYTLLRDGPSDGVKCNVRAKNQVIRNITDLGTDDMRIIYSPGFIAKDKYDNQLLAQYNIQCDEDQLAFFNVTDLDMQGNEDCEDEDNNPKCQDYVLIDRGSFGTNELCGNTTSNASVLELQSRNFNIYFRSSEEKRFPGFQMYVVCFKTEERDLPGCLRPSDFNRSVCTGDSSGNDMPTDGLLYLFAVHPKNNKTQWLSHADLNNVDAECVHTFPDTNERKKREVHVDGVTYSDLFPGYPPGLRLREDVAKFHSQWYRLKRQAGEDVRFIIRLIFFNESVDFIDNTIIITDSDNNERDRYEGIVILQTFDVGVTMYYVNEVETDRSPHFLGPGPLIITGRQAYFQMFVIDPRGLIPTPEEEVDLVNMSRPLLNAVPASLDTDFTETNPEKGIEFSNMNVFTALQNLEACNPVLRSQARATLQFFHRTKGEMLQELLNFTISCILADSHLNCSVDEGFAPALDLLQSTYCTINDDPTTHQPCDPFYGQPAMLTIDSKIQNVTVESINCRGQRVKHTVTAEN